LALAEAVHGLVQMGDPSRVSAAVRQVQKAKKAKKAKKGSVAKLRKRVENV
jgi:hypothetical protein